MVLPKQFVLPFVPFVLPNGIVFKHKSIKLHGTGLKKTQ